MRLIVVVLYILCQKNHYHTSSVISRISDVRNIVNDLYPSHTLLRMGNSSHLLSHMNIC